jgi:hypothetical protein
MKEVGILVVAQRIPEEIRFRFSECIRKSNPKVSYEIHMMHTKPKGPFNKSKLLNKGIKKYTRGQYEVLIQCDIDLVVPPGLVDKSYEVAKSGKVCFYNWHRRIDPKELPKLPDEYEKMDWERYMSFKTEAANGCWNAIQSQFWFCTGGYNEDMIEWGKEDDDWRRRAHSFGNVSFNNYNKFCLIHVNHPTRTKDCRKRNRQVELRSLREGKWNWLT